VIDWRRAAAAVLAAAGLSTAWSQDAERGAGLYLQLPGVASCVSCHGPDLLANRNSFLRAADNPLALQKALNAVGVMGYLKPVLAETDVADLAAFLGRVAPLASGEPALQVWPLTIEFGTLAFGSVSPPQTVQLRNRATQALTLAVVQGPGQPFVVTHDCPATLAPGAACAVAVPYQALAPDGAVGALSIGSSATALPVLVALGGRASDVPRAALQWGSAPSALAFEPIAPGAQRSAALSLVNAGTTDAVLAATTVIGPQAGVFSASGCAAGTLLAPGSGCELRVDYRPDGTAAAQAVLQVRSDGANPPSIALQAAALPPTEPAPSPASGGGASDGRWLMLLALAALGLRRRQSCRRS
jgi:cytochrome c553